jgi:hypothetical protein
MRLADMHRYSQKGAPYKLPGRRKCWRVLSVAACFAFSGVAAAADTPQQAPPPASDLVKSLGGERYQIGKIVVDRKARRMVFPARVHVVDKPLEYLLTTTGGMKEYESLLEADVSGTEFNLGCILLGLQRDPRQGPFFQFSKEPVLGPRVEISVALPTGGSTRHASAAELLFDPDSKQTQPVEWVYVGSTVNAVSNLFGAEAAGTLIGFVHDANSVIESVAGLGIGAYGSVNGNTALLPSVGTEVEMSITVADGGSGKN